MALENEILADLATFYVGFGKLTMNGFYRKTGNIEHRSGYLTPKTYAIAHIISCKINGRNPLEKGLLPHAIEALNEASKYLDKDFFYDEISEASLKERFVTAGKVSYVALQQMNRLTNLLELQKKAIIQFNVDIDKLFYNTPQLSHKAPQATPYMALSAKHLVNKDKELSPQEDLLRKFSRNVCRFNKVLDDILSAEETDIKEAEPPLHNCPICGHTQKSELKERKTYHFICPKCKSHFIIDLSEEGCTAKEEKVADTGIGKESEIGIKVNNQEKVSAETKYVYIGINQNKAEDIPFGKRMSLFFHSVWNSWKCIVLGKEITP